MKKILLFALLAVSCQKVDVQPTEEKSLLPVPQLPETQIVLPLPAWNMKVIEHRFVDLGKIKPIPDSTEVYIIGDDGSLHNLLEGGGHYWYGGKLWVYRLYDGLFNNLNFSSEDQDRGYIIIH